MSDIQGTVGLNLRLNDLLERALSTFVQTGLAVIPTSIGVIGSTGVLGTVETSSHIGKAAIAAGLTATIAAVLSLVKNTFARATVATANTNILLRFAWTFVFAAVAALPTGEIYLDLQFGQTAILAAISAGIASVISLAKNLTATGIVIDAGGAPNTVTK